MCAATLFVTVGSNLSFAKEGSGWSEDVRPAYHAVPQQPQNDMPPVAPDRSTSSRNDQEEQANPHIAQRGGFLTGSASASGMGATVRPLQPQMPRYSAAPMNGSMDADRFVMNARQDNTVTPTNLKGWLQRAHPEFNLSVSNNPSDVIEVKGQWDDAGEIMTAMGIQHRRIKGRELREALSMNPKVVVINCEGHISGNDFEILRQWVIRGGYLITTDWALKNTVEAIFPNTIAWSGSNTSGSVVDASIVATDRALLSGVSVNRATWKLDSKSQEVKVVRPDIVQVLAKSHQLARRDKHAQFEDPSTAGVLACTFSYGRGKVLHLVGHFDYNSGFGFNRYLLPDAIPGHGIGLRQALATNFLIQGLERGKR